MTTNDSKPSILITNSDLDVQTDDIKTELINQNSEAETVHKITSRATDSPSRLVRVFTSSESNVRAAVEKWVFIFNQRKRCEKSRQEPPAIQCYKCLEFGRRSPDCCNKCYNSVEDAELNTLRNTAQKLTKRHRVWTEPLLQLPRMCKVPGGKVYQLCSSSQKQPTSNLKYCLDDRKMLEAIKT